MRKPLSKRDAFIGAIVFSAVLVVILFNIAKGVISGETFDELRNEILIAMMLAIIDYGMVTLYKVRKQEEEEAKNAPLEPEEKLAQSYADPDPDAPIEIKDEAQVLAEKYEEPR